MGTSLNDVTFVPIVLSLALKLLELVMVMIIEICSFASFYAIELRPVLIFLLTNMEPGWKICIVLKESCSLIRVSRIACCLDNAGEEVREASYEIEH